MRTLFNESAKALASTGWFMTPEETIGDVISL